MTAKDFFNKVVQLREAQKNYFKTRHSMYLQKSKAIERDIDREIDRVYELEEKKRNPQLF